MYSGLELHYMYLVLSQTSIFFRRSPVKRGVSSKITFTTWNSNSRRKSHSIPKTGKTLWESGTAVGKVYPLTWWEARVAGAWFHPLRRPEERVRRRGVASRPPPGSGKVVGRGRRSGQVRSRLSLAAPLHRAFLKTQPFHFIYNRSYEFIRFGSEFLTSDLRSVDRFRV